MGRSWKWLVRCDCGHGILVKRGEDRICDQCSFAMYVMRKRKAAMALKDRMRKKRLKAKKK